MSGQSVQQYYLPLVAGVQAVYDSTGLKYYRHADWLGSSRLQIDASGNLLGGMAYAPYGETYDETGTAERMYTGQTQDMIKGTTGIYDFLLRQQASNQGRWLVPDPAGLAAVDITNPQTWNRYAYVGNNPLSNVDPLGLYLSAPTYRWDLWWNAWGGLRQPLAGLLAWEHQIEPPDRAARSNGVPSIPPGPKPPAMNPPKPPSNLAPRLCSGSARVLQGNPDTVGKTGGFGSTVQANSAAVIPAQWGGAKNLRGSLLLIGGTAGTGNAAQTFHGISDTVGSTDVPDVQTYLQNKYPNAVILELVNGQDSTAFNPQDVIVDINLHVPPEISCPSFTTETGRAW